MRRRRDPFARVTLVPEISRIHASCAECGIAPRKMIPLRRVRVEPDAGRDSYLRRTGGGDLVVCSWSCAESYTDSTLGR